MTQLTLILFVVQELIVRVGDIRGRDMVTVMKGMVTKVIKVIRWKIVQHIGVTEEKVEALGGPSEFLLVRKLESCYVQLSSK
jgi:hypothetical protein